MNPCELTATITAITNWLACQFTQAELELLGASPAQPADTLLTIATQKTQQDAAFNGWRLVA